LLDYLLRSRQWTGGVARSVATSHLIDAVAAHHGLTVHETPVGFKYIGELLAKGEVVFGGEESAGMSIKGHVPEKDGILAGALVAEMVAFTGQTLQELLKDLFARVGAAFTTRQDLPINEHLRAQVKQVFEHSPSDFAGTEVMGANLSYRMTHGILFDCLEPNPSSDATAKPKPLSAWKKSCRPDGTYYILLAIECSWAYTLGTSSSITGSCLVNQLYGGVLKKTASRVLAPWPCSRTPPYAPLAQAAAPLLDELF
jgi:hypothetical protein